MPAYTGTQSVETREAAWLTAVDSLPSLLVADGGPWQVVQAFDPVATRRTEQKTIYVTSLRIADTRASNQRIRPQYEITLDLHWPVHQATPGIAAGEFQNLRNATDLVLQRIRGPVGDKTHGGRFLSVAENPRRVDVVYADPAMTIPEGKYVGAVIGYRADDYEVNG